MTQAQAFCIATACLQVPVLTKAGPYKVANNLFEHSTNKLNFFSPSLLFGAKLNKWSEQLPTTAWYRSKPASAALYPLSQHRLRSLSSGRDLDRDVGHLMGYLKESDNFRLIVEPASLAASSGAGSDEQGSTPVPPPSVSQPSEPTTTSSASPPSIETTTAIATDAPVSMTSPPTIETDEPKTAEFPNFNQIHAQILQNSLADRRYQLLRPLVFKKPSLYFSSTNLNNRQQAQHSRSGSPLVELAQLVSNGLYVKKANMLQFWQSLSNPTRAGSGAKLTTIKGRSESF